MHWLSCGKERLWRVCAHCSHARDFAGRQCDEKQSIWAKLAHFSSCSLAFKCKNKLNMRINAERNSLSFWILLPLCSSRCFSFYFVVWLCWAIFGLAIILLMWWDGCFTLSVILLWGVHLFVFWCCAFTITESRVKIWLVELIKAPLAQHKLLSVLIRWFWFCSFTPSAVCVCGGGGVGVCPLSYIINCHF